jgi:hypothetical protein
MTEIIIAFLTGVFGPISVLLIKHYLEKRKKPDLIAEAVNNANVIHDQLDKILVEFEADRVWIAQFHNGGHYYPTGKSIQKFSFFFEAVKHAKDSVQSSFQNIPVNLFSRALSHILDNDVIEIPDYKDATVATYGLKYVAEEHGSKSSYLFAIRNFENRMIGVVGLDYTTHKKKLESTDVMLLRLEATKIGGVLMSHL